VFADGYYEGDPTAADSFRRNRAMVAEDLTYWIDALRHVPNGSDEDVRAFLRERITERARPDMEQSSVVGNLKSFATEIVPRPREWLRAALGHITADLHQRLAVVQRPLRTSGAVPTGTVVSVQMTADPSSASHLYALVQNMATQRIDVFRLGYFQHDEKQPGQSLGVYFGPPLVEGHGPLKPGEAREFSLSWPKNPDGSLPRVEPVFVLFEDFSFIGSAEERAEVLKDMEHKVTDATYWLGVLDEVTVQTSAQARESLEAKLRERAKLDALSTGFGFNLDIKHLLRNTQNRPEEFAAQLVATRARLEQNRAFFSRRPKQ
jgi:hypothetical protein